MKPHVAILSGGSEIVSLALTEELLSTGFQPIIIALRKDSLFRGVTVETPFVELNWSPSDPIQAARNLEIILQDWSLKTNAPLPVFPTEDAGLRLLLEHQDLFSPWCVFSKARALTMGGLDKAELYESLLQSECKACVSPTITVKTIEDAVDAARHFHNDAVIKPSLKPLSMELAGMKGKAFMTRDFTNPKELGNALAPAWNISTQWVVQPRLQVPSEGETVVWAVRDSAGDSFCMAAVEVWKHPRYGGTGCWVRIVPEPREYLFEKAKSILRQLDFIGLCELPFLIDHKEDWRLLELNPRPWLQVGLPWHAGVPLAASAAHVLQGSALPQMPVPRNAEWVNIERLLLAAASGEYGSRVPALGNAAKAIYEATTVAVYGSSFRGIVQRWLWRIITAACSRTVKRLGQG